MKLSRWSLHPVMLPYVRKIVWAGHEEAASPMLLLRLVAEDGHEGVAEIPVKPSWFGTTYRTVTAVLEDLLLPAAAQLDVLDERAFPLAARAWPEHLTAKGLVDTALWDLRASITRQPLYKRWGGDASAPLSWLLTRQPPKLMAEETAQAVEKYGFKEVKLKGGQGMETDVQAVREVRAAVGHDVRIFVDTNSHYSAEETPRYLAMMADEGVLAMEDPYELAPDSTFERVQTASAMPILVDASAWTARDAALFCERGARALALKAIRVGLSETWSQVSVAQAAGCRVHVGFAGESALGTLSSVQLAASLPGRADWLAAEVSNFVMLREQVVRDPVRIVDGRITVPENFVSCAELVDWDKVKALAPS